MKNQRQLNLNDEETQIIMEKLSSFRKLFLKLVKNLKTSANNQTSILKDNQKKNGEDFNLNRPQFEEKKKISTESFLKKYEKILTKAKKLMNSVVDKEIVLICIIKELLL